MHSVAELDTPAGMPAPSGIPNYLWFAGIIEGPRRDASIDPMLRRITHSICQLSLGTAELELEGGRFSIMMSEDTVNGSESNRGVRESFANLLGELTAVLAADGPLESTLRCTEVFPRQTVETLFSPSGDVVRAVSRARSTSDEDQRHAPAALVSPSALARIGRVKAVVISVLSIATLIAVAWQGGLIDRAFAAQSSDIRIEVPGLGDTLQLTIDDEWGNYVVVLSRGIGYPETPAARDALFSNAVTTTELALLRAVADGDSLFIRIEDAENQVLGATRMSLRPLLSQPHNQVVARLPGQMNADHIRIALDAGMQRD